MTEITPEVFETEAMQHIEQEVIQEGSLGIMFGRVMKDVKLNPDGTCIALTEEVKEATGVEVGFVGPLGSPLRSIRVTGRWNDPLAKTPNRLHQALMAPVAIPRTKVFMVARKRMNMGIEAIT